MVSLISSTSTVGIPYAWTTLLWAVILAAKSSGPRTSSEGTLSIQQHHDATTRGLLLGDTVSSPTFSTGNRTRGFHREPALGLGYLGSSVLFGVADLAPGPGVVAARPEQHRGLPDGLRRDTSTRSVRR